MELPRHDFTEEQWDALDKQNRQVVFSDVLKYLVMIKKKKHPLQNDPKQGRIAGERSSLEKFIRQVTIWERAVVAQPPEVIKIP